MNRFETVILLIFVAIVINGLYRGYSNDRSLLNDRAGMFGEIMEATK